MKTINKMMIVWIIAMYLLPIQMSAQAEHVVELTPVWAGTIFNSNYPPGDDGYSYAGKTGDNYVARGIQLWDISSIPYI